jgi:alpha-D-xyloside xylohydrolase
MKNASMRRKSMSAVLLGLFFFSSLSAQNYQKTTTGVKTKLQSMDVEVQFFSPTIVRVMKSPEGVAFKKESLSVIKTPQKTDFTLNQQENVVSMKSDKLEVTLNLLTGKVSYLDLNGKVLFTEKDYGTQFTPTLDVKKQSFTVRQAFLLDKDEAIYGLGQIQNGKLNQRSQKNILKNENTKIAIPFFQSIKGYGIFWDNYAPTTFTDNLQETSFESLADNSDYYFMLGNNANGVVAQMRELTGKSPMIPLWGFGYLQSRERYKTQFETVEVLKKYRDLQVPIDGIIQDWRYWGQDSSWNAMQFDNTIFPRPQAMVDSIHKMNGKLMIVAWPGFGPNTNQYKEFKDKNMLIKFDTWPPKSGTTPYDVYNPEARSIYWNYLNKGVFSLNTDGWWLDSTEPDHINVKPADFDQPTHLGSYNSVINAFPLQHIKGVYENQRKTTSDKRVFILTRSAFAGQQRYGANSWSGDVVSTWETLQNQVPAALNFSMSGLPYWNADIGGFFLWRYNSNNALKLKSYHELYLRWLQFGTFTPMMRSHGTDAPREIYQFGKRGERSFDVIEKYIQLRYKLIPYIYSTAWAVTSESQTFMRALVMDFPGDEKVQNMTDQYMFGSSIMVAPVLKSMYISKSDNKDTENYSEIKTREVYLPKGAEWYDFWTGEKLQGGQKIEKMAPIDIIPLYVKAGSILPWGPKVQYSTEKNWDKLEIRIYPGENGEFTLYEDENDNYNYEKGLNSTITMKWDDQSKTLTIGERKGSFKGMLKNRTFNIVLVDQQNGIGVNPTVKFTKTLQYSGKGKLVKL